MIPIKLFDGEYKFVSIVWDHEPVGSGELVKLCEEKLGWKKSTTYTVLRKLCQRGILQNKDTIVTSLIKREQVQQQESRDVIEKSFQNSLPQFIAAFLSGKKLSEKEAEDIKSLIDSYKEE